MYLAYKGRFFIKKILKKKNTIFIAQIIHSYD